MVIADRDGLGKNYQNFTICVSAAGNPARQ
jgi:hypothetical protein